MADLMIIIEIITPRYPSRDKFQIRLIMAAISVDNDKTESLIASVPLATRLPELIFFPWFFTYLPKKNFTSIATVIIIKDRIE